MSTASLESRFVIRGISWSQYDQILEALGDHPVRVTYHAGVIEFMSPGRTHERFSSILGRMVETITEELDIPLKALGQTTLRLRAADRGLEGDRTFYLANAGRLDDSNRLDLATTPPPDLVIEVEVTAGLLDKLAVYGGLGVAEIWHCRGGQVRVLLLQPDQTYVESARSRALPFLPLDLLNQQLREVDPTNDTRWARSFRAWVRAVVAPLHQA